MKNENGGGFSNDSLFVDTAYGPFPPLEDGSSSVNLSFTEQQLDLWLPSFPPMVAAFCSKFLTMPVQFIGKTSFEFDQINYRQMHSDAELLPWVVLWWYFYYL